MKNTKIFLIAALLGTVLAGCQKETGLQNNEEQTPEVANGYTLVITASKTFDTKALNYDGANNSLGAYWANGEKVDVYLSAEGGDRIGTLTVTSEDNANPATLESSEIDGTDLAVGSKLWLLYPGKDDKSWSYEGQTGTTPDAAYDYATLKLKIKDIHGTVLTAVAIDEDNADAELDYFAFKNAQSVYRFTFQTGGSAFDVKSITMSSIENLLVTSRNWVENGWDSNYGAITATPPTATADNMYCLSIRNENTTSSNNFAFTVVRSSDNAVFEGSKAISKQLVNGKLYNSTITGMTQKGMAEAEASNTIEASAEVL